MHKVLFINGQSQDVADIVVQSAPARGASPLPA